MHDPDLLDVVVTWAGGNRSHNYFPSCLPVAMFRFEHKNELHQLAGRSERMGNGDKQFIVACVENEEAKEEAGERPIHPASVVLEQEDEEIDQTDNDTQIKDKKTVLAKRPRETRSLAAKNNAYKKQKKNE